MARIQVRVILKPNSIDVLATMENHLMSESIILVNIGVNMPF